MRRLARKWRIPDPKHVSLVMTVAYLLFTLTGIATLMDPPSSIVGAAGETAITLVGWFFLAGGAIGMWAGATEFWQLERAGITAMAAGLATYAAFVIALQVTESGSRLTQLGVIIIAGCLLALRMAMIWRHDFKPRG